MDLATALHGIDDRGMGVMDFVICAELVEDVITRIDPLLSRLHFSLAPSEDDIDCATGNGGDTHGQLRLRSELTHYGSRRLFW